MNNCKNDSNTVEAVRNLAEPIAKNLGFKIWDVRFLKEGSDWFLRIFIEKDDDINLDDCEAMSRAIDKPLDELDPTDKPYCLEVCSPGLERELTRDDHFEKFMDSEVIVKTIRPVENLGRRFTGVLEGFENSIISIRVIENAEKNKNNNTKQVGDDLKKSNLIDILKKDTVFIKLNDFNK